MMSHIPSASARLNRTEDKLVSLEGTVTRDQSRIKLLEYKSIDIEARNRRHNLIFRGIKENPFIEEDCTFVVHKFVREHLKVEFEPYIQRAHRLGNLQRGRRNRQAGQQQSPRPIIACFRDYQDVQAILANAYKLANTSFGINRDYPKEILDARAELWPLYKSERQKYPRGSVYVGFPAKLVVNRRVLVDKFPDWHAVLRMSRTERRISGNYGGANAMPGPCAVQGFPTSDISGGPRTDPPVVGPTPARSEQGSGGLSTRSNEGTDTHERGMDIESVRSDNDQDVSKSTEGESTAVAEKSAYDLAMGVLSKHLSQTLVKHTAENIPKPRSNSGASRGEVKVANENHISTSTIRTDNDTDSHVASQSFNCRNYSNFSDTNNRNGLNRTHNKQLDNITVGFLNVCGLRRRLQYPDFCQFIQKYDVICFAETKPDQADVISCSGYMFYSQPRRQKYYRRSGGTGFLVRDSISNFANVIPSESEYISWLKLSKQFHMYDEDIILGCVYIPPQQSRFFNDDEFECMEQEITPACSLTQNMYVYILGDCNAQTGHLNDYTTPDTFLSDYFHFDDETVEYFDQKSALARL